MSKRQVIIKAPADTGRRAIFEPAYKRLTLWISPNQYGESPCRTLKNARNLITDTGVKQGLEVEK